MGRWRERWRVWHQQQRAQLRCAITPHKLVNVTKYYSASGASLAQRQVLGSGTVSFYWLLSDHPGSTSNVITAAGALYSQQLYKPWGESRFTSGTLPTKYQYTGQYSYATGATNDFGLMYYVVLKIATRNSTPKPPRNVKGNLVYGVLKYG